MNTVPRPARAQRGGTLVGFVVGLLVGLGLSLSVALYVSRVPVPFVDRGVSRSPAQDAEEARRNKGWNPNAQIAGPQSPLPNAPSGSDTAGASSPSTDGQPQPASPATAATPPSAPPDGADPLGDLVNNKLGQGTAAAPADRADLFVYFVQAGAFKSPEEAEAQRARLAMMGMSAAVSEREQPGSTVFRVRLGPFDDKAMAEATREQLEVQGVQTALVRLYR